jgi:nucleotide-binding universal stress UspA family protein
MSSNSDDSYPVIDSILHPTDFSEASLVAFHHALKAALVAQARFTLLHVASGRSVELMDFPGIRQTLERWGLLPKDSPRSAVPKLGIDVRKVVGKANNPVESVLHYLEGHPADMIVLATHQHEGRTAWLRHSVAKPIARRSGQMTLFIPEGNEGFVSATDGSVSLSNVLIPVADSPAAQPAVEAAARLAHRLNCPRGTFTLLHVGGTDSTPAVRCPEVPGWEWKKMMRSGDVIHGIVGAAHETAADLVVMSTDGRNGFLDAFRGSHSERVLRGVPAPLLTVPAGSGVELRLQSDRG